MAARRGGRDQLLGTGGTYLVMAHLAFRGFHASCTFGNAPYVDILVSAEDGRKSVAVQVKTAGEARRFKGRAESRAPYELQWPIGRKVAKLGHPHLFLALVDMKGKKGQELPDIYIVPSTWLRDYCAPWVDTVKWVRLHVPYGMLQPFKNDWTGIGRAVSFSSGSDG